MCPKWVPDTLATLDMDKLQEQYLQFMADKAGPPQAANDNHPHSAHGEDRRRFVRR